MSEQNRPADETGHGTDRSAGSGWAPQQSRPASAHQIPGSEQPMNAPTETFPTAAQPSATQPATGPTTAHQPWPPAGYGTPGYQRATGAGAPTGAVPPAFQTAAPQTQAFPQPAYGPQPFPAGTAPFQPARRTGRWRLGVAGLVAGALIGGGAGAGVVALSDVDAVVSASGTTTQPVVIEDAERATSTTAAAAAAAPSVVTLYVSAAAGSGSGSGVVLSEDGYVLTNNHVVSLNNGTDDVTVQVRTSDGTVYDATVVGTDPSNDLAVVKLADAGGLTAAVFADSEAVQVGDLAVAIGAPLGLTNTVTDGIISATNRAVQAGSTQDENTVIDALQTDAAINPGNSGGALVNADGEVIGINTAIASVASTGLPGQETTSGNIGVGFAIPSNTAQRIAEQIIDTGSATHALLGVSARTAADSGSAVGEGALVATVSDGSAADDAGLQAGDVITAVGDRPITTSTELTAAIRSAQPGDEITLTVRRDGDSSEVDVTLDETSN
ncbi:trypsin-like peptidase domain-containing protein [Modestobacter sp. VKM Ac-2983]|uniref:trypsin-like peptidase domain-containing protein n=1 Tax=Modestobacter sp. VKM Ac-2983 TaxID=3004137 RepID=UPI0022AB6EAB|nr:trypsin-like peptidase domain-containing protein [Modestobacter sp. VKM Ac-2983]MCZ2803961.1 trypsin-like peptidase domain-containing protein [Modestobacter sp. VKM Ac-2983]